MSRVLLNWGTGSRGKTFRALMSTAGLVDPSRFRTGGFRVTLFFVAEDRIRGIMVCPSCDKRGEWERGFSARFLERKTERVLDQEAIDSDGGPLDFRLPAVPVDHSHATDAFDSFHLFRVPPSDP